jgi:hypothetical protein
VHLDSLSTCYVNSNLEFGYGSRILFSCVGMAQNAFGTIVVIGIRIIVIESFITEHYVSMGVQSYICKATLCQ